MPRPNADSRTKKVILLSFGQALASASGFIIAVVLSRKFTMQDYGTYRQVFLCFSMVMPFLKLGIPMALYYFLPNEEKNPRGLIVDNFFLLACSGGLYAFFICFGGAQFLSGIMNNPELELLLYVMVPYVAIQLIRSSVPPILMSANRARLLAVFSAASRFCECVFILLAVVYFGSLLSTLVATVIAAVLVLSGALVIVFGVYHSGVASPSIAGMKRQLTYSLPLSIAVIFASIIGYADQLIVSLSVSTEVFAVYANGAIKLPLLSIVVMSVSSVLLPDLSRMYKNSDKAGMLRIWQNAIVKSSYVMLPATVFLMILPKDMILFAFSTKYLESVSIFLIFAVMLPFHMISYGPIFHSSNKNKLLIVINVVTLVIHIPLLFLAVNQFGIIGAAVATVFSQVCIRVFLHIFFIGKILDVHWLKVVPIPRLAAVLAPAILFGLPLALRYAFNVSHFVTLPTCAAYYFPVCYWWLTRRGDAPRVSIVENALTHFGLGRI